MIWRRRILVAGVLIVAAISAFGVIDRPDLAIHAATGSVADALCAKTFVSELDPQTSFAEIMERPGIRRLRFGMRYQIDRTAKTVDVSVAGLAATHDAFHEGLGCVRVQGASEPYLLRVDIVALKTRSESTRLNSSHESVSRMPSSA